MSIDYVSDFTASGMLALAIRWIATGMHESVDEMAKIATEMTDAQHANLWNKGLGTIPSPLFFVFRFLKHRSIDRLGSQS